MTKKVIILSALITLIMISACIAENPKGNKEDNKKDTINWFTNLEEALEVLKDDYDYLLAGDVFNKELIDTWIVEKMKEVVAVNNRHHSFEMHHF